MPGLPERRPNDNRRQYYGFLLPTADNFFFHYCEIKSVPLTREDGVRLDPFWMGWKSFKKAVGCLTLPQNVILGEDDTKETEFDGEAYCLALASDPKLSYLKKSNPTEEQIRAIIKELNECGVAVTRSDLLWYRGGIYEDILWMPDPVE
ncbi:hypothetical protein SCP_1002390 [Sparassis crispa]|uniref:Uncharacterized protein n=1 Tax=Sparassis crispa TaxID=139825 RepID=A0A401GXR7_9APHY|nr:hypothetical protein SCP_1002390 [Sparassis crispa]GBE86993.1 hypothetical protein SCP_1002390 [Sparassis crispa]